MLKRILKTTAFITMLICIIPNSNIVHAGGTQSSSSGSSPQGGGGSCGGGGASRSF